MLVKKSEPIPIECVVRGYLTGSAYKEYEMHHSICGIPLAQNLRLADKLAEPIFTPATKTEKGHDLNISKEKMREMIGSELTEKLEAISLQIYKRASKFLDCRNLILSDTKLEFGFHHGEVILIDELLTPDSSRFWYKETYKPGSSPVSFDKQFLRDYLENLDWDKTFPAPSLPLAIIEKTSEKYLEAYQKITGKKLSL
jgi:phosphoribosylaminoimidazole-succinocarboxamide synthase